MAELKIKADSGGGTVSFKGPATTTSNAAVQLTLPVDDGAASEYLQTNGSGTLSWAAPTVYDDTKLRRDLNILALHTAIDNNKAAHNLSDSFIDQFEGSTGVGSATQALYDSTTESYSSTSISWGSETEFDQWELDTSVIAFHGIDGSTVANLVDGATNNWGFHKASPSNWTTGYEYDFGADSDFGAGFKVTKVHWFNYNTAARFKNWRVEVTSDGTNWSVTNIGGAASATAANSDAWVSGTLDTEWEVPNANGSLRVMYDDHYNNGNASAGVAEIKFHGKVKSTTYNATGNIISIANTASSSRTKVSGVFLYKNEAGTATIGTDLKIYFTCNGGTNWTEAASYTASSDFSTGIKTINLGETTCTAGTDIRYKAEWANQSASKVTQLHAIGVNY